MCKDKDEAEIWFIALQALISKGNYQRWKTEVKGDDISSDTSSADAQRNIRPTVSTGSGDAAYEVSFSALN